MEENSIQSDGETEANKEATEEVKDNSEQKNAEPTPENADHSKDSNNSEYETVDESGDEADDRVGKRRAGDSASGSETEGSITLEREEGDGQESAPAKKVDDDEDKKNPQYIPKRGTFYEHDDRTVDETETPEVAEAEKDSKKKVWQDKKEKWTHDRFNDSEQAPKSRAELISIYGYDIRNEDGPPRARRRRRYGRGPNKYTRNWEDEDAYGKPPVAKPKKPPARKPYRQGEEFPPLGGEGGDGNPLAVQERTKSPVEKKRVQEEKSSTSIQESTSSGNLVEPAAPRGEARTQQNPQNGRAQQRAGSGRTVKPKTEIKDSDYRGFTRPRNYKNSSKTEQRAPPRKSNKDSDFIHTQNFTNKSQQNKVQDLEADMNKLSVQDANLKNGNKANSQRQGSMPPRLQGEQKSSKRYSSLRQRSLPETAAPPFGQHPQGFYPNEFNQAQQQAATSQQQPSLIHTATATQVPQIPPPPIPAIPQQVPAVSATPILQAPPQFAPTFPQAGPPFLPAGVPAPAFIPQQTPQIINYVQSQAQFPQAPYQGYQQAYNAVNQPAELYQPQGGITYYSAQEQQVAQRAAPLKRPKAAIPIVPPPPAEPRGRGRGMNQPEVSPNSNAEGVAEKSYEISNKEFEDAAIAVEQ